MTHKKKLTDEQVADIRKRAQHEPYRKIAADYGIDYSYVSLLYKGKARTKLNETK